MISRQGPWLGHHTISLKELHLVSTPSLRPFFERVHWCCIHIFLRQTVPTVDDSLWEELKTGFTVTEVLQKFSTVTSVYIVLRLVVNSFQGVLEKPLINLKSSMRSVLLRCFWRDQDQAGEVYHHMAGFEVQKTDEWIDVGHAQAVQCPWRNMDFKQMSNNPDAV